MMQRSRFLLEKLVINPMINKLPVILETETSSPSLQKPANGPRPEAVYILGTLNICKTFTFF